MKRFLIALITILLCILMLRAELLWRVTTPDGKKTSFLFGTHHVAPLSILDSIDGFKPAFDSVSAIMGEIDMINKDEFNQDLMAASVTSPDSTISRLLTPQQCDSLEIFLKSLIGETASIQMFDRYKPAVVSTMISMLVTQRTMPEFNPNEQLDLFIQAKGNLAQKKILALESSNYQISILMGTPIEEQLEQLMGLVRSEENLAKYTREMNDAYLNQDLDALQSIIENPEAGTTAKDLERLIYNRNRNWIPMIKKQIDVEPTMFVFGAGHLCGKQGVIELLRNEGYIVEPVK